MITSYEVRCYSAPYENTTLWDYDKAIDLCYNLSEEYGHTEVVQFINGHQHVLASYSHGVGNEM